MAIKQKIKTREELREALLDFAMPPKDMEETLDVLEEINSLKKEKNAVVLGHWYMRDAVKLISDYLGDSLDLSKEAANTDADIILFAGVNFMAETAKILSPDKKVLLPSLEAGCSLAESITGEDVKKLRKKYPEAAIVTYINTTADVKAECDVCVTSANAKKIISRIKQKQIVFVPDKYMGANLKREMPEKEIILYEDGFCILHEEFVSPKIESFKRIHPELKVLSHYECDPSIIDLSDMHGGTNDMIKYIEEESEKAKNEGRRIKFLMATECGLSSTVKSLFAQKNKELDIVGPCNLCPYMKKIDIYNVRDALRDESPEVNVPEKIRIKALKSINKMFELGK